MTDLTIYEVSPEDQELVYSVAPETEDSALLSLTLSFPLALVTQVGFRTRTTKELSCRLALVEHKVGDLPVLQPVKSLSLPREDDHLDMEYADGIIHFSAVCVSSTLKLTFECDRPEYDDLDQEVAAISNRMSHEKHWAERIFKDSFTVVGIMGYSLLTAPDPLHSLSLINIAQTLSDHEEAKEALYLAGLALIGEKKSIQAAEFIRRAEAMTLAGVNMQANTPVAGQRPNNTAASHKIWSAAKLEIVVADGFAQVGLFKQQVLALQRAVELYQGGIAANSCQGSLVACLLKLHPHLTRILLKSLSDPGEPVRLAALRSLRAVVELQGCSLGSLLPVILKSVIRAYYISPTTSSADIFNNSTLTNVSFTEILLKDDLCLGPANEYQRLLQALYTLLSDCSPQLLQKLFTEGVIQLTLMDMKKELKVEVLRLAARITELLKGDLEVDIALLKHVLTLTHTEEYKESASILWETLRNEVLPHYTGANLAGLLEWLREAMAPDCGVDAAMECLQLVTGLAKKTTGVAKPELARMKQGIEYWVQFALGTQGQLALFQQAWTCLEVLAGHLPRLDLSRIAKPILDRTLRLITQSGVHPDTLQFLKIAIPPVPCKEQVVSVLNDLLSILCSYYPGCNEELSLELIGGLLGKLKSNVQVETLKTAVLTLFEETGNVSIAMEKARTEAIQASLSHSVLEPMLQICLLDNVTGNPVKLPYLSFAVALLEKCGPHPTVFGTMEQLCNACDLLLANDDPSLKLTAIKCLKALTHSGSLGKSSEKIDTAMLVIGSLRYVLETDWDVDMLFLGLQLLYQIFTELVPVSTEKRSTEFRASEIVKLWTIVTKCVDSGWSRIAAYAAALMRNWAGGSSGNTRLSKYFFSYLLSLASAKDTFRRDLFLSVLGHYLGFGQTGSVHVPLAIWELVFVLQLDWNPDLRTKARVLVARCAPKDIARELSTRQQQKLALLAESSQYEFGSDEEMEENSLEYAFKEDWGTTAGDLQIIFKPAVLPLTLRDSSAEEVCRSESLVPEQMSLKVDLEELPLASKRPPQKMMEQLDLGIAKKIDQVEKPQPPPESKDDLPSKPVPETRPNPMQEPGLNPAQEYFPMKTEGPIFTSKVTDSKRSPRTPRKSLEQELELALKPHAGVPAAELMTKIYLQRPDMTLFRRKTKSASLSSNSARTRKTAVRPLRPSPIFKEH